MQKRRKKASMAAAADQKQRQKRVPGKKLCTCPGCGIEVPCKTAVSCAAIICPWCGSDMIDAG